MRRHTFPGSGDTFVLEEGESRCDIISTSDTPRVPNSSPKSCANRIHAEQQSPAESRSMCDACCERMLDTRTAIGYEICAQRIPTSVNPGDYVGDYLGWGLMCAQYVADLNSQYELCLHSCRTEFVGDEDEDEQ